MKKYLPENLIKLEHFQNHSTNRSQYLIGLALDLFQNPNQDRQCFYAARELYYTKRYQSAIKLFEKHAEMNGWLPERSQAWVYVGDCYLALDDSEMAIVCWHQAFTLCPTRREPLLRLADYYFRQNDHQHCAAYANASLVIPQSGYYMDDSSHYRDVPHHYLYWALFYLGQKEEAKKHYDICIGYQPNNERYLHDRQFFS